MTHGTTPATPFRRTSGPAGRVTRRRVLALGLGVMVGAAALAPAAAWAAPKLRITTTTAQVGDAVRNVAGDLAEVEPIMGPGVDPHLYRPTRSDVARMARADLVFYNGLHLEGQMTDMLQRLGARKPVVPVTERLAQDSLLADVRGLSEFDPHVWMDVKSWMLAVRTAADVLESYDPDNAATYAANRDVYLAQLDELNAYVTQVLATVPDGHRVLITAHDAFNYFGARYGFEVVGIQGISTESEAGLQRIEEIVDLLVSREIPAVFVETSVSERNVRALIEGAAARGHEVRIGGTLFSDAMGEPGTYEGTYIGMLDHNATVITRALGGSAPPAGMQGRLTLSGAGQ